jgi:hypothetical protein
MVYRPFRGISLGSERGGPLGIKHSSIDGMDEGKNPFGWDQNPLQLREIREESIF